MPRATLERGWSRGRTDADEGRFKTDTALRRTDPRAAGRAAPRPCQEDAPPTQASGDCVRMRSDEHGGLPQVMDLRASWSRCITATAISPCSPPSSRSSWPAATRYESLPDLGCHPPGCRLTTGFSHESRPRAQPWSLRATRGPYARRHVAATRPSLRLDTRNTETDRRSNTVVSLVSGLGREHGNRIAPRAGRCCHGGLRPHRRARRRGGHARARCGGRARHLPVPSTWPASIGVRLSPRSESARHAT